jgi:hypothetical protein
MASLRELVLESLPDAEPELRLQHLLSSAGQGDLLQVVLSHRVPCLDQIKAVHATLVAERGTRNVPILIVGVSRW